MQASDVSWRHLYETVLIPGRMREYYDSLTPRAEALREALACGDLLEDRRLQQTMISLTPSTLPSAPPGSP